MWSDNETDVDLLRYRYLVASVLRLIRNDDLLPTTIGIFGDWGTGKSSLIKMIEKEVSGDPSTMCLSFSGWLFEDYNDAKTALMGSILDAIQDHVKEDENLLRKTGHLLHKLINRVNWFQAVMIAGRYAVPAAVGLPKITLANLGIDLVQRLAMLPSALVDKFKAKGIDEKDIEKLIKESADTPEEVRRDIRDFRKDFAALLDKAEIKRLVVFIDDLDRCDPDNIIATLEAIKLFLFVPGTAFILGADERLVQYAVRRRFPELPGTDTEVGRDYLEKLVQFPVRLPPLGGTEIQSYINILFAKLQLGEADFNKVCEHVAQFRPNQVSDLAYDIETCRALLSGGAVPAQLELDLDLTAQIAPVLTPGLGGNPRRTKRFLNTLLLRMWMSEDRGLHLQRQVLSKLMLLEYLKPEFFKQLATLQATQVGQPLELSRAEEFLRQLSTEEDAEQQEYEDGVDGKTNGKVKRKKSSSSNVRRLVQTDLQAEIQSWLADEWMQRWLVSEPALRDVDLRPYFYVAHDKVGVLDDAQTRLSPAAADVLNRLLDSHEATRTIGLRRAEALSDPDATALFESLARRLRQAESLDNTSPQSVIFKLMEHRPELIPQVVALFSSLPENKITAAVPRAIQSITRDTASAGAAHALLVRWEKSNNRLLSRASVAVLSSKERTK
ncbi:MAG TPA: P-loop NTPase fold protein [Anaerolineales bacterium]|nr:P-loop NTPase fold protein [Anaerolineales bacterium]